VVLLALLLLAACGGGDGTVRGIVTQAKDAQRSLEDPANVGEPLAGAAVVAYNLERYGEVQQPEIYRKTTIAYKGTSAEDGSFSFSVPPGKYVVEVWVNGLTAGNRQVTVKSGGVSDANFNVKLP
jgi:hypothetical protein